MGHTPNTWCRICGARYSHCTDCEKSRSWRAICDTPLHFQVFAVLQAYLKDGDKARARGALRHIGVEAQNVGDFLPPVQAALLEILQ